MSTAYQWLFRPDTIAVFRHPEPTTAAGTYDYNNRNFTNFGIGTNTIGNGTDFDPIELRLTSVDTLYYQRDQYYERWIIDRQLFGNWKVSVAQGGSLGDKHMTLGFADSSVDFTAPHNNYASAGNGFFFEINTGIGQATWYAVAIRAGVVTRVNTTVAPTTDGSGQTMRIVWDLTNITFYIDGVQVAQIAAANGPVSGSSMSAGMRGYSGDPGATGGTFFGWDMHVFATSYGGSP